MNVEKLFLITSNTRIVEAFELECATFGIEIERVIFNDFTFWNQISFYLNFFQTLIFDPDANYLDEVYNFIYSMKGFVDPVVVLSAEAEEILLIAEKVASIQVRTQYDLINLQGLPILHI